MDKFYMRSLNIARVCVPPNGQFPSIHLLNKTTRLTFGILFVMLIGAIVFPFAFGIQCVNENEKIGKCSGSCVRLM